MEVKMQKNNSICIIQMHTNTIPSKLVKSMTRYEYSHVAISLEKDCNTIYSFGRRSLNNVLNGGFTYQSKKDKFFEKFKNTECRIYEICVTQEQYKKLCDIIQYMRENDKKYKYDFGGIVLRHLKLPITFKNKYVCSYFIAELLERCNIYKFDKKTCFVTPRDFENMIGAEEIFYGKFIEY